MSSHLNYYMEKGFLDTPPQVNKGFLVYEAIMGSRAYGCNKPDSDYDMYGILVPPLSSIFSHTAGIMPGFGSNPYSFDHYEQQHILDEQGKKEYSFHIFNIVRFFDLLLGCNPNIIEVLFCPQVNVTHITQIGHLIRDNRHLFLSKLYINKMRAYAVSQLKKAKDRKPIGKRKDLVEKYGFDTKSAQNLLRLTWQAEQVLLEKDLDLGRNATTLLEIRNGQWSLEKIEDIFNAKHTEIEKLVLTSDLPAKPDENQIKNLLLQCIELQYGKMSDRIVVQDEGMEILKQIHILSSKALGETNANS